MNDEKGDEPGFWDNTLRAATWLRRRKQVSALLVGIAQRLGDETLPVRFSSYQGIYTTWRQMRLELELREVRVVSPHGLVGFRWCLSVRVRGRMIPGWFRFTRKSDSLAIRLSHYETHDTSALMAVLPPEVAHRLSTTSAPLSIKRSGLTYDMFTTSSLTVAHDDFVHQACDVLSLFAELIEHLPHTMDDLDYKLLQHATDEAVLGEVYTELLERAEHEERFPSVLRLEEVLREAVDSEASSQALVRMLSQEGTVLPLLIERAMWDEARGLEFLEALGSWSGFGLPHHQCVRLKLEALLGPEHLTVEWARRYPGAMFPLLQMQWHAKAYIMADDDVLKCMPCEHLIRLATTLYRLDSAFGQTQYSPHIVRLAESKVQAGSAHDVLFGLVWELVDSSADIMLNAEWFELMMCLIPTLRPSRTNPFMRLIRAKLSAIHLRGLRMFCNNPDHKGHHLTEHFNLLIRMVDTGEESGPVGRLSLSESIQDGQLSVTTEAGTLKLEEE